ncbi:MAG: hypothetical protein ABIE68_05065 [bacterium]
MKRVTKTTLIAVGSIIGLIILVYLYFFFGEIRRMHFSSCDTAVTETSSLEKIEQVSMAYYKSPNPDIVVPMINTLTEQDTFQTNSFGPMAAFFSRIFADNPDKLERWVMQDLCGLNNQPLSTFDVVVNALWMADTPEARDILNKIEDTTKVPDGKNYIESQITREVLDLKTMSVTTSLDLDIIWSAFFATGDKEYIEQIVSVLYSDDENSSNDVLLESTAKWSLKSNYADNPKIKEVCDLNSECKNQLFSEE